MVFTNNTWWLNKRQIGPENNRNQTRKQSISWDWSYSGVFERIFQIKRSRSNKLIVDKEGVAKLKETEVNIGGETKEIQDNSCGIS